VAYDPKPIDTSGVEVPPEVCALTETLAENTHNLWAMKRRRDGWVYGPHRGDENKTHPNLVPYGELQDHEKEYDRTTAMEALKVIIALGYEIRKKLPEP